MALIKCSKCGHMVSDKAKRCPKCGYPINNGYEANENEETIIKSSQTYGTDEDTIYQAQSKVEQKKNNKTWLWVMLILLALAGAILCIYKVSSDSAKVEQLEKDKVKLEKEKLELKRKQKIAEQKRKEEERLKKEEEEKIKQAEEAKKIEEEKKKREEERLLKTVIFECTGDNVNVRVGPGQQFDRLLDGAIDQYSQLYKGEPVRNLGEIKNGFVRVLFIGYRHTDEGWVALKYLKPKTEKCASCNGRGYFDWECTAWEGPPEDHPYACECHGSMCIHIGNGNCYHKQHCYECSCLGYL